MGEFRVSSDSLVGSRIREKRLDRGLRQAAVAETVGISPSYLNLIEHNRRRIGGKLLADLARVLEVDTALLADGAEREMLDEMRSAAASMGDRVEVERTEELAARYPGWGALIATQARRIAALEEKSRILTDRISYDPQLAGSLHEVISAVSAIRSTASILVGPEDIDRDWQRRFHENIHSDSLRLADSSEALITYLEAPEAVLEHSGSPFEAVEAYLAKSGFHVASLESGADPLVVAKEAGLPGPAEKVLLRILEIYADDAAALPLAAFEKTARTLNYDPAAIAQSLDARLPQVMRRLAQLPPQQGHPPMALVVCDASGALIFIKSVPGFTMPRTGGACPLWPLYGALSRPHQPIRMEVQLPAPNATRFLCFALAEPIGPVVFDVPSALQSVMLLLPDPPESGSEPHGVGLSCRICPRTACRSRREPAIGGVGPKSEL
ncbi:XRE family transcriptional regulator [Yoonia rosea]|uniref:XRE family transcriptional regulator n=1 Tax=Yoonia rosea TaxID=287098 RepID=UPI000A042AFA|nr:XRE family transcriptional regulator [Yoonia rosea]